MTTEEHLDLILAFCRSRLALAAKRTPGKWNHNEGRRMRISVDSLHEDAVLHGDEFEVADCDAAFIAACAGAAEAGWRATIAAIETFAFPASCDSYIAQEDAATLIEAILAAYPLELLKT